MSPPTVTHVCLVDACPTAGITPVIDPEIPSHRLIVASTTKHKLEAHRLITLAKTRGFNAEYWSLPDSGSVVDIKLSLLQLLDDKQLHPAEKNELWFNLSEGSRWQAIAANDVAAIVDAKCFVVDTNLDRIVWLRPDSQEPQAIQDKLRLHEYFSLYEVELNCQPPLPLLTKALTSFGERWAKEAIHLRKALSRLNYLAANAKNKHFLIEDASNYIASNPLLSEMIDELSDSGVIKVFGKQLQFLNEQHRFFCNGGWLEQYVYRLVCSLKTQLPMIQDVHQSVEISRLIDNQQIKNELDVALLANNRLHIIECKTAQLPWGKGNDILYKLDSLASLTSQVGAKAALVTFNPLQRNELIRAKEFDIEVFGPERLPNLRQNLFTWIGK